MGLSTDVVFCNGSHAVNEEQEIGGVKQEYWYAFCCAMLGYDVVGHSPSARDADIVEVLKAPEACEGEVLNIACVGVLMESKAN